MHFKMSSAICSNLDQSKILWSGNGLRLGTGRFPNKSSCKTSDRCDIKVHVKFMNPPPPPYLTPGYNLGTLGRGPQDKATSNIWYP